MSCNHLKCNGFLLHRTLILYYSYIMGVQVTIIMIIWVYNPQGTYIII